MAKKGTFPANAMRRGEIFWVDIPNAIGHELMKDRPAIIVRCDALNDNSPVVQEVSCSASPKQELPEHITIRSTEQISTALCENVYTVDKSRVGRFVGRCTRREMEQVDRCLLSGLGLAQYGLASPQEDEEEPEEPGTTFAENALIKAETICKASGLPTIADDSGLCVDALDGAPGVYSARYCGRHGDDEANNDKLLDAMQAVPAGQRGAKFVSAVCFILPDGRHLTCMGECPGSIAFERLNGDYGFGYDPLFIPADCGVGKHDKRPNTEKRSYAQLTPDEKDAISHRGNALAELEKQLPGFLNAAASEGVLAQVSGKVEIEIK